jgi:beta-barrel assembly-enhancing protease
MKQSILFVAMLTVAAPVYAQFGGLDKTLKKAQDAKKEMDSLNVSDDEERKIGEDVSAKIRQRFGVVQDAAVHKYVTLVGTVLAQQSERPNLAWRFIVLDTDGVNAFASPGGIVHITRGALGLIRNEAELAAVLAHEIGHVAHKHTVNAIKKNKAVQLGSNQTLANRAPLLDQIANKAYEMVLENKFDRGDELDADKVSVTLTAKVGYAPGTLADFLARLDDRNKDQPARNGLFASHPETKERIDTVRKLAVGKTGALVEARYKTNIKYEPTPVTSIATVADGAAGLTGSTTPSKEADKSGKTDEKTEEAPKKKGFGIASLKPAPTAERQSAQVSASGGSRGLGPDRAAKGGANSGLVKVSVSDAEVAAFKKGIA